MKGAKWGALLIPSAYTLLSVQPEAAPVVAFMMGVGALAGSLVSAIAGLVVDEFRR
jgi:hypothetical protein